MKVRVGLVLLAGIVAAALWSVGFSWLYYQFYLAVGAPDHSTQLLTLAIPAISFGQGIFGALLLLSVGGNLPWARIFFILVACTFILGSAGTFAGLTGVLEQLQSEGFWAFVCGLVATVYLGSWLGTPTAQVESPPP